jgi:hypothetical protein
MQFKHLIFFFVFLVLSIQKHVRKYKHTHSYLLLIYTITIAFTIITCNQNILNHLTGKKLDSQKELMKCTRNAGVAPRMFHAPPPLTANGNTHHQH